LVELGTHGCKELLHLPHLLHLIIEFSLQTL
jgi:hypothetical protein